MEGDGTPLSNMGQTSEGQPARPSGPGPRALRTVIAAIAHSLALFSPVAVLPKFTGCPRCQGYLHSTGGPPSWVPSALHTIPLPWDVAIWRQTSKRAQGLRCRSCLPSTHSGLL